MNEKKVLIFSHPNDQATLYVSKWLKFYNQDYCIINSINDLNENNILLERDYLENTIKSIWYRKLHLTIPTVETHLKGLKSSVTKFMQSELKFFYFGIETLSKNIRSLGSGFSSMELNKIEILSFAKEIGINTPNFLLTMQKNEVLTFKNKFKKIITKPIFDAVPILINENIQGIMYTKHLDEELINNLPPTFFPSFFQELIEKSFEVRIFYLDGYCFSSAIISSNEVLDYRNQAACSSKWMPYQLPIDLKKRIHQLMQKIKLNTGSIDLIKSVDGKYYFLEVNPSGHYDAISSNCNYNLHKKVAEWLINQK